MYSEYKVQSTKNDVSSVGSVDPYVISHQFEFYVKQLNHAQSARQQSIDNATAWSKSKMNLR
jgi:hypothetical protein